MPRTESGLTDLPERVRPTVLRAPAKINLALHVTGRRADGYHLLDSLVAFTELGDRLTVEPSALDRFEIDGMFAETIPADGDNLVLRARDAFRARCGTRGPVSIRLTKTLPPASGIGGGSSDAAACLIAMEDLRGAGADLTTIGAALGADVPMCLQAEPLIARGIGDEIEGLAAFPALHLVLANPRIEVPTREIFRRLPSPDNAPLPPLRGFADAQDVASWLAAARNDLQAPAIGFAPQIADVLAALETSGAILARMSGSGATCFGIFANAADAARAAGDLRAAEPRWFVAPTASHAAGAFERRTRP